MNRAFTGSSGQFPCNYLSVTVLDFQNLGVPIAPDAYSREVTLKGLQSSTQNSSHETSGFKMTYSPHNVQNDL
jgi:hypothetical protein